MPKRDAFFKGLDEIDARARAAKEFYLRSQKRSWPADRVERRRESDYRRKSEPLTRCSNPHCRSWPPAGSRVAGRCLLCGTTL